MEKKYSKILSKSNILLGVHCLSKGILILLLFIILYSVIWLKEKYLNYIKISIYIQILIFLFILTIILITNNPNFFDICLKCTLYIFLILSVLQIVIIALEIIGNIKNFKNFEKFFHECPYYRSYNDIMESKYKRTCLFYNEDPNSESKYKYICYYNSEEEYYNHYCDGIICKKNNIFYNNENDYTKCIGININYVSFPENNIYFQKERKLFNKNKNKKVYLCSRKKRLDDIQLNNKNNQKDKISKYNILNLECPDNNPSKKYIVFIYLEFIMHFLVDLIFIYEIFFIKSLNQIYFDMSANSRLRINANSLDSNSNSSNNRVNTPSDNEVIVNIDRKKDLCSENDEDDKIKDSSEKNNIKKLKIDMNDNRRINIININQNINICKNTNNDSLLENGPKNLKMKGKFIQLKEKEKNEKKIENGEFLFIDNKHHHHLKSSQLKNLINISFDNSKNDSSNEDNNIEFKKIKDININKKNKDIENNLKVNNKNKKEDEKINKFIYFKKSINIETNLNTPINKSEQIFNPNTETIIQDKSIRQKSKEIYNLNKDSKRLNFSFDTNQKEKGYEENKEDHRIYQNNNGKSNINNFLNNNNN